MSSGGREYKGGYFEGDKPYGPYERVIRKDTIHFFTEEIDKIFARKGFKLKGYKADPSDLEIIFGVISDHSLTAQDVEIIAEGLKDAGFELGANFCIFQLNMFGRVPLWHYHYESESVEQFGFNNAVRPEPAPPQEKERLSQTHRFRQELCEMFGDTEVLFTSRQHDLQRSILFGGMYPIDREFVSAALGEDMISAFYDSHS